MDERKPSRLSLFHGLIHTTRNITYGRQHVVFGQLFGLHGVLACDYLHAAGNRLVFSDEVLNVAGIAKRQIPFPGY